jgi:hypothetical protein
MISTNPQIISIMNKNWYVETQTGLDGPFESENEASNFLERVKACNSARLAFAGLQFTPLEGS